MSRPGFCAVELRTNYGVRIPIYIAKLGLDLDILFGVGQELEAVPVALKVRLALQQPEGLANGLLVGANIDLGTVD